jgi:hypothetical protein
MHGIEVGDTFAVGRMRRFPMDPDGWGDTVNTIGPRDPGQEYVVLVLGRVPRGQRITQEAVVQALRDVLAREEALLAGAAAGSGPGGGQ